MSLAAVTVTACCSMLAVTIAMSDYTSQSDIMFSRKYSKGLMRTCLPRNAMA